MRTSSIKYLVRTGTKSLWINRVMTFASFCVMLVSMLLIGLAILTSVNINRIIGAIEDKNEVVVQIYDTTPQSEIESLQTKLENTENVASVTFYPREQALEDIKADMTPDEQSLFDYFDDNPLPDTFRIKIDDISLMGDTVLFVSQYDFVETVSQPTDFATLLTDVRNIISAISLGVVVVLIIICLIIISNTTRASVFARKKEIEIMKYVGATNTFINLPFFVEGLLTGLLAAAVASVVTKLVYDAMYNAFSSGFQLWSALGVSSLIPSSDIMIFVFLGYIAAGIVIGAIGITMSTRKHLRV